MQSSWLLYIHILMYSMLYSLCQHDHDDGLYYIQDICVIAAPLTLTLVALETKFLKIDNDEPYNTTSATLFTGTMRCVNCINP